MPCFTMSIIKVDLEGRNPVLLKSALEAMGYTVQLVDGKLSFRGRSNETGRYEQGTYIAGQLKASATLDIQEVKQSYAASVLKKNAAKYGWELKKTSKYNYQIQKK